MTMAFKHHHVPACYLAGFAEVHKGRTSQLAVFDRLTGVIRKGSAGGEAKVDGLYRIDHSDPEIVERLLSKFEAQLARVLDRVRSSTDDPTHEDVGILCNFVALQAMRSPERQEWFASNREKVGRLIVDTAESIGKYPTTRTLVGKESVTVTLDDGKALLEQANDPTTLVMDALKAAADLVPVLGERAWVIGRAPADCRFICSDNPVMLDWVDPRDHHPFWGPRFGLEGTVVMLPLSATDVFIGTFANHPDGRVGLTSEMVASINTFTALHAHRWIYAGKFPFRWLNRTGICDGPTQELRHGREDLVKPPRGRRGAAGAPAR
jgi:hypothetical protein